jgi:hypothetical protein
MIIYALPGLGKSFYLKEVGGRKPVIDSDLLIEESFGMTKWQDLWNNSVENFEEKIQAVKQIYNIALEYSWQDMIVLTNIVMFPTYWYAVSCSDDYVKRIRASGDRFKEVTDETLLSWRRSFISVAARSNAYYLLTAGEYFSDAPLLRWELKKTEPEVQQFIQR